jgi:hypothetical protein
MLHKIMGNLGKNAGNRGNNIIFFPPSPNIILMRGKKYHKKKARAAKKGEKARKDKVKEKKSGTMTEQEQCLIKLWETWEKMQALGDIILYFFP